MVAVDGPFRMGDQPSTHRMPGSINSTSPAATFRQVLANQPLVPDHNLNNVPYYSHSHIQPRHVVKDHGAGIQPLNMPSLQPLTPYPITQPNPLTSRGKRWDTARIILLQREAIDTVEICPTLTKYANAALGYTEKVSILT